MARRLSSVDLFLLAGEPSGDLQGAKLVEALLSLDPTLRIAAVAGPEMRKFPIECVEPMESLQVMGFTDVLFALPKIARLFFSLRRKILKLDPKAFVGIDYPGFNLRLHQSLKKSGFKGKLIHYICPTVWAWGKKRIPRMAATLDQLLTILPFEPSCFSHTPLPVEYVGHPLTEAIRSFKPDPTFRKRHGWQEEDKILAIFPGSRKQEVERNLPLQLQIAKKLQAEDPRLKIGVGIPFEERYQLMHTAHMALAKSGTVALELALHRTPTIVQYAIRPIDVFLATRVFNINLPFYSLPNLILQTEVFPELIGPHLTEERLYEEASRLWSNDAKRTHCQTLCETLWTQLGSDLASLKAAKKILNLLSR
jgi:lipid-A-disaccharide synthase